MGKKVTVSTLRDQCHLIFNEEYAEYVLNAILHSKLAHDKLVTKMIQSLGEMHDSEDDTCPAVPIAFTAIVLVTILCEIKELSNIPDTIH
jgi:hypothetical protein